jgi:hypothetical protein
MKNTSSRNDDSIRSHTYRTLESISLKYKKYVCQKEDHKLSEPAIPYKVKNSSKSNILLYR